MNYHHVHFVMFLKCQLWASHTLAAYGLTEMDYFSSEERKSYTVDYTSTRDSERLTWAHSSSQTSTDVSWEEPVLLFDNCEPKDITADVIDCTTHQQIEPKSKAFSLRPKKLQTFWRIASAPGLFPLQPSGGDNKPKEQFFSWAFKLLKQIISLFLTPIHMPHPTWKTLVLSKTVMPVYIILYSL